MLLAVFKINSQHYSLRLSKHATERIKKRKVKGKKIAQTFEQLGKKNILEIQKTGLDTMIVNKRLGISFVLSFLKNKIYIVTVLNKTNVFIKSNTALCLVDKEISITTTKRKKRA